MTLQETSGFYNKPARSKERKIEKLRAYISQLENSESRIAAEFEKQLREKDRNIKKLAGLLKSGKGKKGGQDEIAEIYKEQLSSKNREIEKLRRQFSEIRDSEKGLVPSEELEDREEKIKRLLSILKLKEDESRRLSEQLDEKIITERDYAGKIKDALAKKERSDRNLFESLREDLSRKKGEAESLRTLTLSQDRIIKQLGNSVSEYKKHVSRIEAFLEEKDSVRDKLEQNFLQQLKNKDYEIGQLSREIGNQTGRKDLHLQEELAKLKTRFEIKETETNELAKNFANLKEQNRILSRRLEERQKLFVESESNYNRLVHSLREQQESRLKGILHKRTQSEIRLRAELDTLKARQSEKDAMVSEKQKEIDETLMQFAETSKRLLAMKGEEGFSGVDVSAAQLKEKEEYMKKKEAELASLLKAAAEKVSEANRKEAEIAKREQMLLKEQEAVNNELAILKSAGISIGRDREYLRGKIQEYSPGAVEQPQTVAPKIVEQPEIAEPEQETAAPEPKFEELQQVEAEPETRASSAVSEEDETSDVLGILRKRSVPKAETPALKGKKAAGVFKQARSKAKLLPKPPSRVMKAKVERPKLKEALIKQSENQDSFPEESGYGEMEEIKSIIDIGLQHGDTVEQIKDSLESSGYSKKNIDKAFQGIKR